MSNLPVNSLIALPERHGGAARLSVFFALWTLALLVMHDVRVNAAPIYENSPTADSGWLMTPAPAPQIDATSMWDAMSQQSDVMSGRWNGVAHAQMHSKVVVPASRTASAHTESRRHERVAPKKESTAIVKTSSDLADAERQVARRIAARDFGGAIELIQKVRVENPHAALQLRVLDAHVAIGQGEYERAYVTLLDDLPDIHVSTKQHDLLAAVMVRTSRYAEAAAIYRALLTLDSSNTRWWAGYAVTQEKLGRHSELIGAYRTLRTLAPPGTSLAVWADQRLQRIG